jgi:hypothetical protein
MPPIAKKLAQSSYHLKCANYWQSVLRFGLPFVLLYRGIDYAVFRLTAKGTALRYPWRFDFATDLLVMFIVATLWWLLMREIAAWKVKNEKRQVNGVL